MLVITRKEGEEFHLTLPSGDVVVIKVLKVNENAKARGTDPVSLGIDAPSSVRITRPDYKGRNHA